MWLIEIYRTRQGTSDSVSLKGQIKQKMSNALLNLLSFTGDYLCIF